MGKSFTIDILNQSMELKNMKGKDAVKELVQNIPSIIDSFLNIILEDHPENKRKEVKLLCITEITSRLLQWDSLYSVEKKEVTKA